MLINGQVRFAQKCKSNISVCVREVKRYSTYIYIIYIILFIVFQWTNWTKLSRHKDQ